MTTPEAGERMSIQNHAGSRDEPTQTPAVANAGVSPPLISSPPNENIDTKPSVVHLDPPPRGKPIETISSSYLSLRILGMGMSTSSQRKRKSCARAPRTLIVERKKTFTPFTPFGSQMVLGMESTWTEERTIPANENFPNCRYLVIGAMGPSESIPNEVILPVKQNDEDLFKQIRKGIRLTRPFYRRILSLKHVSGFSIYECVPDGGYHTIPELDNETKSTLLELYRDFKTLPTDHEDRWLNWIHANFNNGDYDPAKGKFALRVILQWSPVRLIFWGMAPVFLSLAIGFGYMYKPTADGDFLTVVQTAWGIASYIVTTAALAFATAAAITQIGDV